MAQTPRDHTKLAKKSPDASKPTVTVAPTQLPSGKVVKRSSRRDRSGKTKERSGKSKVLSHDSKEPMGSAKEPKKKGAVNADPKGGTTLSSDGEGNVLEKKEYFHGLLPREEITLLLQKDGDFLVRESRKAGDINIVMSVKWGTQRHFIIQMEKDGTFRFETASFPSVPELIRYHFINKVPITEKSNALLLNPIKQQGWEIKPQAIKMEKQIGKGNFGEVWQGFITQENGEQKKVAIKTCRTELPEAERMKFYREARLMRSYDHENVVNIIGMCCQKDPIMIVMELLVNGSLLSYLKKNRGKLKTAEKLKFSTDAAIGMDYLESKGCIHRDLAARNCLLGNNNVLKISDFGMSRQTLLYKLDGAKQIPVKWTAPEALQDGVYTSKSDVWSFGILMWEIFSEGQCPYPGLQNKETAEEVDKGYRMPPPPGTPPETAALMTVCWSQDPTKRPAFRDIKSRLSKQKA